MKCGEIFWGGVLGVRVLGVEGFEVLLRGALNF